MQKLYPLDQKSIDYIEADGNYVTLRAGKVEYLSRDSIKRLSMQLAEVGFVRIARSLLVNAAAVLYAEVAGHKDFRPDAYLRCLPAFERGLPRIDSTHYSAAGSFEALRRRFPRNRDPSRERRGSSRSRALVVPKLHSRWMWALLVSGDATC